MRICLLCLYTPFRFITLKPGDVVLTGSPPGVGFTRNPPEFLKVVSTSK